MLVGVCPRGHLGWAIRDKFLGLRLLLCFDTDPFNTWKSAFRECVKLSSRVIDRQKDNETQNRLVAWCTKSTGEFKDYAEKGAKSGAVYGARNKNNKDELAKINDFDWLKERFNDECK